MQLRPITKPASWMRWIMLVAGVELACVMSIAHGAVKSVGSVNPVPPSGGGTFTTQLVVGDDQAASPDTRAWLQIDNGSQLQYGSLIVGDEGDENDEDIFFGEFNIVGNFPGPLNDPYTQFTLSGAGTTTNPTVQIGRDGRGVLNVSGGATMTLTNASSNFSIGVNETGVGSVSVSDPFTNVNIRDDLIVGQEGIGRLEITGGALVRTTTSNTSRGVFIGKAATGVGTLIVDGEGSILRTGSKLVVGESGQGTLIIGDQAIVDADTPAPTPTPTTITVGPLGRIEMNGGTLIGDKPTAATAFGTTVNGYLGGSGLVRSSVNFSAASRLEVGTGDVLRFDGKVDNQGAITVEEGELRFLTNFANKAAAGGVPAGRITLEDGTIRFTQPLTNDGVIVAARGANNFHGEITLAAAGSIVVASDTVAIFNDKVTNFGDAEVLARGNALFLADMEFAESSALALAVGLDDTSDNSAQIGVAGVLTLDGDLTVSLESSYVPEFGDSFELLTAGGGISGTFDSATLPDIPGNLEFGLFYTPNSVVMATQIEQNTIGLPGDYNRNGVVDAADFVVWRDRLGDTTSLANDDTPGVGQDDYDRWRANFGAVGEIITGAALAAVPEPSSALLMLVGAITGALCPRRLRASTKPPARRRLPPTSRRLGSWIDSA